MTKPEFMRKIGEYYGYYPKGQLPYVAAYVDKKRENFLEALFVACIENFSAKWKTPPDIAIFKELEKEAYRIEDQQLPAPNEYEAIDEDYVDPEVGLAYIQELYEKIGHG